MVGPRARSGFAGLVQLGLAGALVAAHFETTTPFLYPHYVLLIVLHPFLLRYAGIGVPPWQRVYISTALFLHPIGGLYGLYKDIWWYDHLTHFLSATLVASIGYVLARSHAHRAQPHPWFVPVFTVAFVLAAGFVWELAEPLTPFLTVYGPNDTWWDYVFNLLGGLLVVAAGRFVLADAAAGLARRLDRRAVPPAE